ncbi:MAG: VOC family protein [Thaumarchaeota archaeon]|nr:VOC family protein [Nitrososphaerota archaeon]
MAKLRMEPNKDCVKPIPDGYHTLTPYLVVEDVPKLIDFLKKAFGAKELERTTRPDGTVRHAELRIGDSVVMMAEARGESKPMPCMLYVYTEDTNATYERAIKAGATSLMEPADQFYGDRNAGVKDPVGNSWWLATRMEDVSPNEIQRRSEALSKAGTKA